MAKCLICESENVKVHESKLGDFLSERVDEKDCACKLLHCCDCGFAYYDYRLTDEQVKTFYKGYRSEEYQKQRQKHDCWYTPELNEIIGKNEKEVELKKSILSHMINKFVDLSKITNVLDFGGDKGQNIPVEFQDLPKFVYELSDVEPIEGVELINSFDKLGKYDFIMCEGVLEHISNLDLFFEDFEKISHKDTYLYIELPFDSPFFKSPLHNLQFLFSKYYSLKNIFKHYLKMKREKAFCPMCEHQNYFTKESAEMLLESKGFEIISSEINVMKKNWCTEKSINILTKKKEV